jgi:glutamyl-tRNA reductase
MSNIILIGLNHKTAAVEVRERLAFSEEEAITALKILRQDRMIRECLLFSTCNRTEIVFIPEDGEPDTSDPEALNQTENIINIISCHKNVDSAEFRDALYIHQGEDAVRHLFRVASSLDSMIIGEPQILGQIKQSYRLALDSKCSGVLLNRLMHKAFSVAKRVRRETGIGDHAVSISYAAIELAHKIFSNLSEKAVLLLGAGEMAELAVEHLLSHGVKQILVANRTFKNALVLAEKFQGKALRFEEREDMLSQVDIIVSSTGASEYVLTYQQVRRIMKKRQNRTLFFIDIAVPRDIDPKINSISNAYVYDIDDLKNVVDSNIKQREKETVKAERLIDEAVLKFSKWMESLAVVPTIKALNDKITTIIDTECGKTLANMKHLSEQDIEAIQRMTKAIASKTIHDPIRFMRNIGEHRDDSLYLNVVRQLFNLGDEEV